MLGVDQQITYLVTWLRKMVQETKTKGLIVGMSGGVDSAVVSFLIKMAFPDDSLGVVMPCHSHPEDIRDALSTADVCGIETLVVDLSPAHDLLLETLSKEMGKTRGEVHINRLVDGNLRARLRMTTLYAVANQHRYLVVGTDNAAELYTGYFTKYGDGGVDLLPLAHLLKRNVYRMARQLGVPSHVLEKAPSAGLWVGQDDESEMGTTYNHIDDFLVGKPIPNDDRERISRMHRLTEHKRTRPAMPPSFPE